MYASMSRRELLKSVGLGALAVSLGGVSGRLALAQRATTPSAPEPISYDLPMLPYTYDALAPGIEEQVLRVHHEKHHAGYVKGLNTTLADLELARAAGDFAQIKALSRALAFHGSGHILHSLYWGNMIPGGSPEPRDALRAAIDRDFGSFAAFKAQFLAASKGVEASGWGVLAYEPMGRRLLILQAEKHQNLTVWGVAPLLVCDVWEHAYYAQYKNRRADYVDNFFNLIDWPAVTERCLAAIRS